MLELKKMRNTSLWCNLKTISFWVLTEDLEFKLCAPRLIKMKMQHAPVSFRLLHFGSKMSHRGIKTHTGTQVLLSGPWGRGEPALAPLGGKPHLLTSAAAVGAAQRRETSVCEYVASWWRDKHGDRGGSEKRTDRAGDNGPLAVVMATLACHWVNRCLLLT